MKLLTVIGARPQFIKAATISRLIRERDNISEYIVHTGQHYDQSMSEVFFKELDIPKPSLNLNVGSGLHGEQTAKMLCGIEQAILTVKPDVVLVYGDTNSTLAGALAAVKLHIPICHVEAGLRSFNRKMPEEINRIMTDHASDILFAPTLNAVKQLKAEGISEEKIILSGDVMYDAALYYGERADLESSILNRLEILPDNYVLTTVHRAENTDTPEMLTQIMQELDMVALEHTVILPIHPRTRVKLDDWGIKVKNIRLIDPISYLDMVKLEKNAKIIITDSGGVQKEAYFFGKPCITLRAETEWVELVDGGWNTLLDFTNIERPTISDLINFPITSSIGSRDISLYGTGNSAHKIIEGITELSFKY